LVHSAFSGKSVGDIAIAIEVGAEALLSFDTDQMELAEAAGVTVVQADRQAPVGSEFTRTAIPDVSSK
jgi:hypothetical protein